MLRLAAVWLVLFSAYAATIGFDAFGDSRFGGDEPHYLLLAESITADGDYDLTDDYAERSYAGFYPYELDRHAEPQPDGRLLEPHGVGFSLLISPAYALGGPTAVELLIAALVAFGFVLALLLARHVVPEPWATVTALGVGLSPPALAYGSAVYPELIAGGALAGAALLALRLRERPRLRYAYGAAVLLALMPWLGTKYLIVGLPVAVAVVRWTARRGRRLAALGVAEVMSGSLVVFATFNERLYGGLTPYSADAIHDSATDAEFPLGYLERLPRLVALWIDRDYGLLRWAPVMALAFFGAFLLWRSVRDRVARAIPERRDAEVAASIALAVCAGAVIVAAFGSPSMYGFWFPSRHLLSALPLSVVLVAWGLRRAPRAGAALLALTALSSCWLVVDLLTKHVDGWVHPATQAPFGPLVEALPLYGLDSPWADAVAGVLVAALLALAAAEWRAARQIAGRTRRAYSP